MAELVWDKLNCKNQPPGGLEPSSYRSELRCEPLRRVASLGASIRITIYSPPPAELAAHALS